MTGLQGKWKRSLKSSHHFLEQLLKKKQKLGVGDAIKFKPNYMGVARLMTSTFVKKEVTT